MASLRRFRPQELKSIHDARLDLYGTLPPWNGTTTPRRTGVQLIRKLLWRQIDWASRNRNFSHLFPATFDNAANFQDLAKSALTVMYENRNRTTKNQDNYKYEYNAPLWSPLKDFAELFEADFTDALQADAKVTGGIAETPDWPGRDKNKRLKVRRKVAPKDGEAKEESARDEAEEEDVASKETEIEEESGNKVRMTKEERMKLLEKTKKKARLVEDDYRNKKTIRKVDLFKKTKAGEELKKAAASAKPSSL